MKILALVFLVAILACALFAGPYPATTKYTTSAEQAVRLQAKRDAALYAQFALQEAKQRAEQTMADLNHEAVLVKQENNWPDSVNFDANILQFTQENKGEHQ